MSYGRGNSCDNVNHVRASAPVSHCPQCGGVVNGSIRNAPCDENKHALARRRQSIFCADCGTRLVFA